MLEKASLFLTNSAAKAADLEHRRKINFNISKYNAAVPKGKAQFYDIENVKELAKNLKWKAIESLDKNLLNFEKKITARGATVIWAENAEEVTTAVLNICKNRNCKTVVKSKSMVTEEVELNHVLEANGIESIETDLGEYIQQLDGEPPYHIVTPAMHKSKEDVAKLFAEKLGTDPALTPPELTQVARKILREKYTQAEVGITGANFIIGDIGAVAVTENEGNARLSCAFPKTHIVIVGIEKMIPSIHDLALFWPLLSTYGTGQTVTVYNTIISGPRQAGETDGPEEMFVILMDNGRTHILADTVQRESLYCIRCGACLNVCPVYKNIGGHTYDTTYSGPIGSVITPNMKDMGTYKHLSYASTLCGACTEVCPMNIRIHELLIDNRKKSTEQGLAPITERTAWRIWRIASLKRGIMNIGSGKLKNKVVNSMFTSWKENRSDLQFSDKSFNQMWKERMKKGS